ncbi:MAG TPA: hypothetical protein VFJ16_16240 [Longimicrobium sp.]|nr:hypothetical protein [Longimicrobium sp.]
MMKRAGRLLAAGSLALAACAVKVSAASAQSAPHPGSAVCTRAPAAIGQPTPLAPGEYTLTLMAMAGTRSGARTRGLLRLRPTSRDDRSPRTGKTASAGAIATPLYGTAELDWRAVGAPMADFFEPSDTVHPAPTLDDPVYPGVLVLARGGDVVLSIGSVFNRRDGSQWMDGAGIGLRVRGSDARGFWGTCDAFGIVRNGSGYFCAVRR